ncbi:MAG: helix-turn-helix domain-containing protein [Ruminococcus sp.]|nr:helix-turn-helix domain-containing protein [Ruminococcus sp.]MBR6393366.1 helix-turn-helix domain-containing protein [Ruminococcus sp.]
MKDIAIPVWERYALTVTEAAEYYHIGETKLRRLAEEHPDADFIIMNGNRVLFKRIRFERFLDQATAI